MSENNIPPGSDGEKPEIRPNVLDEIYSETAPSSLGTQASEESPDPSTDQEAITPRLARDVLRSSSSEILRTQAGSYGPNPSELPDRGDVDPMTGRRIDVRDGSNDIEVPEQRPSSSQATPQQRVRTPEISRQGLDSAYTLLRTSTLPNDPTINAMSGLHREISRPTVTPGKPPNVSTGLSEGAGRWARNADTSRNQSSVDLPSVDPSLAASVRSKASLTATKVSEIGSKISEGMSKLVKNARRKKRKSKVKKNKEQGQSEEEADDDTGINPSKNDGMPWKRDDDPEPPHPTLRNRGGSTTEVLNLFGFDPVECETSPAPCQLRISATKQVYYPQAQQTRSTHHIHPSAVGRITLQPILPTVHSYHEPIPPSHDLDNGLEENKRLLALPARGYDSRGLETQFTNLTDTSTPNPSNCFLPKVKDVNSALLLQQEITAGKLVKVKYAYSAKRADEFELDVDLLLVVLLIVSDSWALGSTYEDALDYIASRQEFSAPDGSKLQNPQSAQLTLSPVGEKPNAGEFKGRLPMMKFFPLEAIQLVQPYEWAFHPYTPTLTSLKLRSNLATGSKRGLSHYKLHNPPPRGISKKSDLLYGENKRLVSLGYEKFVAEVLQKIIEETRFSMQRIEEISLVQSKDSTPLPSPTASGWTSSSSPTSGWSETSASSPTRVIIGGVKFFPGSNSPGSISPTVSSPGGIIPTGSSSTHVHAIAEVLHQNDIAEVSTPSKLAEKVEPIGDEVQPLEMVDNKIAKLINNLSGKSGKKHILKDSWRWATKSKEKLFRTMLKKRNKGEGLPYEERADTPYPRCIKSSGPGLLLDPTHSEPLGFAMSKISEQSRQHCSPLGLGEFPTSRNQDTSARVSRRSVRDLFADTCITLNPNLPTPCMTYPEGTGTTSHASALSRTDSLGPGVPKVGPPKLSINTQLLSPIQLIMEQPTITQPVVSENKMASLQLASRPPQANSATRVGLHEWYRAKINSPTSRSTNDIDINDHLTSACSGRGRERERSDFGEQEFALSPTCTTDWAARSLIAKVKRARESMRRISSAVAECEDDSTILSTGAEEAMEGKENWKMFDA